MTFVIRRTERKESSTMGDKMEQPGPSENKAKVIEPLEGDDVEGHRRVGVSLTEDQPGPSEAGKRFTESDEDDVEGHRRVGVSLTEDQPGPSEARHKVSFTESDEDDVEGHRAKVS
jgi:hypothetical protein